MATNKDILINDSEDDNSASGEDGKSSYEGQLLDWILTKTDDWLDYRRSNFDNKWKEYYRLWRGVWDAQDRVRESEKSRLIAPALQQAVESSVAEQEEATFGNSNWFDIRTYPEGLDEGEVEKLRMHLQYSLDKQNVKSSISEIFLNAALYGTGIGEVICEDKEEFNPSDQPHPDNPNVKVRGVTSSKHFIVRLEPISPFNFGIDPSARNIDEALGCCIDIIVPKHTVMSKMQSGDYITVDNVGSFEEKYSDYTAFGELREPSVDDKVRLLKYYGLVPKNLLDYFSEEAKGSEIVDLSKQMGASQNDQMSGEGGADYDMDTELVEAIVVIANDSHVVKAVENPYMFKDRPVISYQHDRVPNRFYGRGVCEKGYNPQKALDAELRARIDALALTTHPMMAADATRLPRGAKLFVEPGKTILTNGDPKSALMPITFGNLNQVSFRESAELERMVTMATGAMDSAAPTGVNPRNATASGMSMMQAGSIKRQKRTLANFQDNFFVPFIKKASFRFMQFDPTNWPALHLDFIPSSSIGIMAREYEQQQLTNLLSIVPPDSPAWGVLLKGIFANSSLSNRDELEKAVDGMLQQMQAQQSQPNPAQAAQAQKTQVDTQLTQAKIDHLHAKTQMDISNTKHDMGLAQQQQSHDQNLAQLAQQNQMRIQNEQNAQKQYLANARYQEMQKRQLKQSKATNNGS